MLRRVSIIQGCTSPLCFLFTAASELLRAVLCVNSAKLKKTWCDPHYVTLDLWWNVTTFEKCTEMVESTVSSASQLCELLVSGFTLSEELLQRRSICKAYVRCGYLPAHCWLTAISHCLLFRLNRNLFVLWMRPEWPGTTIFYEYD